MKTKILTPRVLSKNRDCLRYCKKCLRSPNQKALSKRYKLRITFWIHLVSPPLPTLGLRPLMTWIMSKSAILSSKNSVMFWYSSQNQQIRRTLLNQQFPSSSNCRLRISLQTKWVFSQPTKCSHSKMRRGWVLSHRLYKRRNSESKSIAGRRSTYWMRSLTR